MNFFPEAGLLSGTALHLYPIRGHGWIDDNQKPIAPPSEFTVRVVANFAGEGERPTVLGVVDTASSQAFAGLWCLFALRGDENDLREGVYCNVVLMKERPPELRWPRPDFLSNPAVAAGFAKVSLTT